MPNRNVLILIVLAGLVGIAAIAAGATVLSSPKPEAARPLAQVEQTAERTVTVEPARVQMPDVVGMELQDAETIISAAGMGVRIRSENPSAEGTVDHVVSQEPAAGALTETTVTVTLLVRTTPETPAVPETKTPAPPKKRARYVVCIDPGHQARSDSSPEPIAPGSKKVRPKVTGGATGVKTHIPEYELNLQISMNLRKRLEAQGVKVVMTRTTNDVNLSNSERAAIASKAKADLFVRIHSDGSPDSDAAGISTLYPERNRWTKSFSADSKRAARLIQRNVVEETGANDRGIHARGDLTGFNWAKVPAVLVECGFVSNPVEDRLLASPHYQDKVATGISEGVLEALKVMGR